MYNGKIVEIIGMLRIYAIVVQKWTSKSFSLLTFFVFITNSQKFPIHTATSSVFEMRIFEITNESTDKNIPKGFPVSKAISPITIVGPPTKTKLIISSSLNLSPLPILFLFSEIVKAGISF